GGDGGGRARLDGGRVAGAGDQAEGEETEERYLTARRPPVGAVAHLEAHGQEGGEQDQQAAANEPDGAALSLQQEARERRRLERGARPAFQQRRLRGHGDQRAGQRDQDERPAAAED